MDAITRRCHRSPIRDRGRVRPSHRLVTDADTSIRRWARSLQLVDFVLGESRFRPFSGRRRFELTIPRPRSGAAVRRVQTRAVVAVISPAERLSPARNGRFGGENRPPAAAVTKPPSLPG